MFLPVAILQHTMHELAEAWTSRDGRIRIAATAVLYVLVLIPFNYLGIQVSGIPLRPAAFLPVPLGILCGPAAAWGLGIANIAGDFFGGSWSLMSIPGALVNFLLPYLSYRLFHALMRESAIRRDLPTTGWFLFVSLVATTGCMLLLAACGTIFFGRPFESKFISYTGNSLFWTLTVGTVFFWLLVDPAWRKRLVYGREWDRRDGAGPGGADVSLPASSA